MSEVAFFVLGCLVGGVISLIYGFRWAARFCTEILNELMNMGKLSKAEANTMLDRVRKGK